MAYRANIHEAKTHFSRLLQLAHEGEEVIVAKAGRDYVRIVPIRDGAEREAGAFRGKISGDALGPVADDDLGDWG
jgi:prevent-host-death family protein